MSNTYHPWLPKLCSSFLSVWRRRKLTEIWKKNKEETTFQTEQTQWQHLLLCELFQGRLCEQESIHLRYGTYSSPKELLHPSIAWQINEFNWSYLQEDGWRAIYITGTIYGWSATLLRNKSSLTNAIYWYILKEWWVSTSLLSSKRDH